jgi:carboxymethylenebutenolidase
VQKIGITGYCMGGTFALRAACEISELAAAAPFYGDIPEESVLKKLRVPTLFIAGNRDAWINPEKVKGLIEAARTYDLPVEAISYAADHAFFNDTRPEVYDAEAAADAWRRVLDLFRKNLAAAVPAGA